MYLVDILNIFLTGAISTLGAFVPLFFLLCIHFYFRKIYFKERKARNVSLIDGYNKLANLNDVYIQKIYKEFGVKDYVDFSRKTNSSTLLASVNQKLDEKTKNLDTANELAIENNYIENYNFKIYLATLLDRKYPDKYLR